MRWRRALCVTFVAGAIAGGVLVAREAGGLDRYLDAVPVEPLILQELEARLAPGELDRRIRLALAQGHPDDAEIYADIAAYMGRPLAAETHEALIVSRTSQAVALQYAGSFLDGFISGAVSDTASLAGAVTADLSIVGDIRDIGSEGGKMLAGAEYSKIILGLSVAGVALTAGTVASGGGILPARLGASVLKAGTKTGAVTARFGQELTRLVTDAVDFSALRNTLYGLTWTNPAAGRRAMQAYADTLRSSDLAPVLADMDAVYDAVGAAESLKLMRHVDTTRDLENIAGMTKVLGPKTRGIIDITGKTSLRAFKSAANILRWLAQWLWAAVSLIVGWIGLIALQRLRRRARRGTVSAARPQHPI